MIPSPSDLKKMEASTAEYLEQYVAAYLHDNTGTFTIKVLVTGKKVILLSSIHEPRDVVRRVLAKVPNSGRLLVSDLFPKTLKGVLALNYNTLWSIAQFGAKGRFALASAFKAENITCDWIEECLKRDRAEATRDSRK